MNKSELINHLQAEYQNWEAFLDQIGSARMDLPGVNGDWSMKDIVAHLTGWNRWLVARVRAALGGEPEPPPPWPSQLGSDDEINAWIHEHYRNFSVQEVMEETDYGLQQLLVLMEGLPEDVRIEHVEPALHLVWIGEERYPVSEFFDHFRDDHEADVRAWLVREESK
ncbi:MAG: ClbS/DfsB family four-helix bundle protein [Bacteroidota bacterium]